jgi:hypothetical protein
MPTRPRNRWVAQLLVVGVGFAVILGSLALLGGVASP